MSSALESLETGSRTDERKPSPPAFLDLADSSARLGSNMSDISARVELKRMEHERQRAIHRQIFEQQMMVLEQKQAEELLSIPVDSSMQHVAVSAPTTPPRITPQLMADGPFVPTLPLRDRDGLARVEKRKSVTYSSILSRSPEEGLEPASHGVLARPAGAKSMPGSRRPSAGSHDSEELNFLVEGLNIHDRAPGSARLPPPSDNRVDDARLPIEPDKNYKESRYSAHLSAGFMLDKQLDQEMQNAMLHLPTSDDDKHEQIRAGSYTRLSTASAALDLAPLAQTPPRTSLLGRALENNGKSSEWPQFSDPIPRNDRRVSTNPIIGSSRSIPGISKPSGAISASTTPLVTQHTSDSSRRSSPPGMSDSLSTSASATAVRSVPATPLGGLLGVRADSAHPVKSPITPLTPGVGQSGTLSRVTAGFDTPLTFNTIHNSGDATLQLGSVDGIYGLTTGVDSRFSAFPFESQGRGNSGSTALYHHHGTRYGLGLGSNRLPSDGKMNGLHGPKHKRSDMDREFNRFAGTRLEDLQGEIASLCKDQHGCRYLQKKLEEGASDHRDMIFRETYGHFSELMTDPFGNYLCQKLLEYSTDEQRTIICDSVAQDLVNISLNMHGTRAVQKMIDFLSVQRQTDIRYDAQIHSIILALSLHVVVLIKDLNGNHVIQKCLNKLNPEDNQFIYNAVAANCVEVATHRHGCCVLQRCIDHASDLQRVQLVNEITYNALTLVQDPYGNYVVQYILDLNDNRFSDAVIRQFTGNVCALSVQKFSSNVIEKCIRVAEQSTRKLLVDEMLHRSRLEKLLRDSYGNYCVQTALDYADPGQRLMLVEGIRPILPLIRNTPYGKRIQSKLQREQIDGMGSATYGGYHHQGVAIGNNVTGYGQHPAAQRGHALRQGGHINDASYNGHPSLYAATPQHHAHGQNAQTRTHHSPSVVDSYLVQNGIGHRQNHNSFGTSAPFMQASFANGAGLNGDPYSRSAFPYGI